MKIRTHRELERGLGAMGKREKGTGRKGDLGKGRSGERGSFRIGLCLHFIRSGGRIDRCLGLRNL